MDDGNLVVSKLRMICTNNLFSIYFAHGKLLVTDKKKGESYSLGTLPGIGIDKYLSYVRILVRILRLEPRCAMWIDEYKFILSYHGKVYLVNLKLKTIVVEHKFRRGMNNPLTFCKVSGLSKFPDCILYGEYWGNPNREETCVYARINKQWRKIAVFEAEQIKHIHGIVVDTYNDRLLVLTGDSDNESGIWEIKGDLLKPVLILGGKQKYRTCVLIPKRNGFIYATDTPLEKNYIREVTVGNNLIVEKEIYEMPGPCIYGTVCGTNENNMLFATSVEPDSRIKGIRGLFTYQLGRGVEKRSSYVIRYDQKHGFSIALMLKKDLFPMNLCQFGNVLFPCQTICKEVYLCPISCKNYDGKTLKLTLEN